jgi:hypothetical protein
MYHIPHSNSVTQTWPINTCAPVASNQLTMFQCYIVACSIHHKNPLINQEGPMLGYPRVRYVIQHPIIRKPDNFVLSISHRYIFDDMSAYLWYDLSTLKMPQKLAIRLSTCAHVISYNISQKQFHITTILQHVAYITKILC